MTRPPKNYSKQQIQNAIDSTLSYCEAARYLNSSYNTFKKYTKLYGLWIEGGKNPSAKGIPKPRTTKRRDNLNSILEGNWNGKKMNLTRFRNRLIKEIILPEKCDLCGLEEKRIPDYKVALALTFKDGDHKNYKLENLQLKCFNCIFYTEGNIVGRKKKYFSDLSGDIYSQIDMA